MPELSVECQTTDIVCVWGADSRLGLAVEYHVARTAVGTTYRVVRLSKDNTLELPDDSQRLKCFIIKHIMLPLPI